MKIRFLFLFTISSKMYKRYDALGKLKFLPQLMKIYFVRNNLLWWKMVLCSFHERPFKSWPSSENSIIRHGLGSRGAGQDPCARLTKKTLSQVQSFWWLPSWSNTLSPPNNKQERVNRFDMNVMIWCFEKEGWMVWDWKTKWLESNKNWNGSTVLTGSKLKGWMVENYVLKMKRQNGCKLL